MRSHTHEKHTHTPTQTLDEHGAQACCGTDAHPSAANDAPVQHHGPDMHGGVHGSAHGSSPVSSPAGLATAATVHCLTGCAIGELAGLAIGVTLGLGAWPTMLLATALGFLSGYSLGLLPLVRQGMGWLEAFKLIWLGETISIAFMEFAMNFTDYHIGGVQAASVFTWQSWLGYALALPAGFVVAWPVNYWLLKRNVKKPCH